MRSPKRQRQKVWFVDYTEVKDGFDSYIKYGKPLEKVMTVSATSGHTYGFSFGWNPSYDRYITSYERDYKPKEGMYVFVDVIPQMDMLGNLVLKTDGITPITAPDYKINRILDTQRGHVARYGIERLSGNVVED